MPAPVAPATPSASAPVRRALQIAAVVAFCAALAIPLLETLLRLDSTPPLLERRALAPMPAPPRTLAALAEFPKQFEPWFNDHFGLRNRLVRGYYATKVLALRDSPVALHPADSTPLAGAPQPGRATMPPVLVGRDRWLFYADAGELRDIRNTRRPAPAELNTFVAMLEDRAARCERLGAHYVFAVAPNKSTIYPEFLPQAPRREPGPSAREAFIEAARRGCRTARVVDLTAPLASARAQHLVFHPNDMHWNATGAYFGAAEILRTLGESDPRIAPAPLDTYARREVDHYGDLAEMLGLERHYARKATLLFPPGDPAATNRKALSRWAWPRTAARGNTPLRFTGDDPARPSLMMFHDSFGLRFPVFFGPQFSKSSYCYEIPFDEKLIAAERPTFVIELLVERHAFPEPK